MKPINDYRRLRVSRITVHNGELTTEQGAELWQDMDGVIHGVGLWHDILIPNNDYVIYQAKKIMASPLEVVRQRLALLSYLRVDIL